MLKIFSKIKLSLQIYKSLLITSPTVLDIAFTNVEDTLKQRQDKVVSTLKIRRRIFFHFQHRINVISKLIHNVETTLMRRWNVDWDRIYYNCAHNILRLFNILLVFFLSPNVKRDLIISNKSYIYELPYESPGDLRLRNYGLLPSIPAKMKILPTPAKNY